MDAVRREIKERIIWYIEEGCGERERRIYSLLA
jgi:hypothetical protein